MKNLLFYPLTLICLTLINFNLKAQVKLTFRDSDTDQFIEDVVVNYRSDIRLTDSNGTILIPRGITTLTASRTGYIDTVLTISSAKSLTIFLTPDNVLGEVSVYAFPTGDISTAVPASSSNINSRQIAVANNLDYSNVLNNVPGVFMQNGTLGTNRITMRGIGARTPFGTNKIRAYYNEIPLTAVDGETSPEDNDLQLIGSITVVRGPSSTAYGAGLGGLIRLSPVDIHGNYLSSKTGIGSFGLLRTSHSFGLRENAHSLQVSYATTNSDGYRDNNQYDRNNVLINYRHSGEKISIDFLATLTGVEAQIPSSLNASDFEEDPTLAAANWAAVDGFEEYRKGLAGMTLTYLINSDNDLSTTIYPTFRENYELRPFGILTENSILTGFRWKYNSRISSRLSLAVGGENTRESYESTTLDQDDGIPAELTSFNDQKRSLINLYAEALWQLSGKVSLISGLNFSQLSYDLNDLFRPNGDQSGSYRFEGIWSPRLFAGYKLNANHQLYAQLSHGFSAPSLEETLTPEGIINPDISPEKGYSIEIGSKGKWRKTGLSYNVNLYRMIVSDLLVARRTAEDEFIGINAGKTSHRGLEIEVNYRKRLGKFFLSPFGNASFGAVRFVDFIDEGTDYAGNFLPGVPKYTASLGLFLRSEYGLDLNVNYRMAGEMLLRDDNELSTESYRLLNLKMAYRKSIGKIEATLEGGINNLNGVQYASQILINAGSFGGRAPRYFYPGLPRNYFCSLSLRYKF